jgi:hypothetical protein
VNPYGSRAPVAADTGRARCCRSSVVEHSLGKGEADSSILSGSTILFVDFQELFDLVGFFSLPLVHTGGIHGQINA